MQTNTDDVSMVDGFMEHLDEETLTAFDCNVMLTTSEMSPTTTENMRKAILTSNSTDNIVSDIQQHTFQSQQHEHLQRLQFQQQQQPPPPPPPSQQPHPSSFMQNPSHYHHPSPQMHQQQQFQQQQQQFQQQQQYHQSQQQSQHGLGQGHPIVRGGATSSMHTQFPRPTQPATVLVAPLPGHPDAPRVHINLQTAEQLDPSVVNSGMFQRVAFAELSLKERLAPAASSLPVGAYPPGHPNAQVTQQPIKQLPSNIGSMPPGGGTYFNSVSHAVPVVVPSRPMTIVAPAPTATPMSSSYLQQSHRDYPQPSSPTFSDDFRMNMPSTDNSDIEIDEAMFEDWMEEDDGRIEFINDTDISCCSSTYQWASHGCSTIGQQAGCFGGPPSWGTSSSRSSGRPSLVQPTQKNSSQTHGGFFATLSSRICGPQGNDLMANDQKHMNGNNNYPKTSNFGGNFPVSRPNERAAKRR